MTNQLHQNEHQNKRKLHSRRNQRKFLAKREINRKSEIVETENVWLGTAEIGGEELEKRLPKTLLNLRVVMIYRPYQPMSLQPMLQFLPLDFRLSRMMLQVEDFSSTWL
jgi:hypothetical protein